MNDTIVNTRIILPPGGKIVSPRPTTIAQEPSSTKVRSKTEPSSPASTSPSPPEETIPMEPVIATIALEDGTTLCITEKDLKVNPNLAHFARLLARYEALVQKLREAKGEKKVINFSLEDPALQVIYLINISLENNFPEEALEEIENRIRRLSDQNEDKPYLLIMFAHTMLASGKIEKERVEKIISEAAKLAPENQEILYQVYQFYLGTKDLEKAQSALEAALKLTPNDPGLLLEKGRFFLLKSELAKAEQKYDQALEFLALAREAFQKTTQQKPELQPLLLELENKKAEILSLKGEKVEAFDLLLSLAEECKRRLEKNPENTELYFRLATTYLALLKIERKITDNLLLSRSRKITRHLKSSAPTDSDLRRLRQDWTQEALKALEKAKEKSQDNSTLLAGIADAYLSLGEIKEALELYQQLAQKDPGNPIYPLKLGDLLLAKREIVEAFANFEKVLNIAEKSKDINLITEVYLRFSFLKTQTRLALAKKEAERPNFLQVSLNFLGTALLTYLNPFVGVVNFIGAGLNKALSKNFTEAELKEITKKADTLERQAFSLVEMQKDPAAYFVIAESMFFRAQILLLQIRALEKDLTNAEEIKVYQKVAESLKTQAVEILEATLKKCFDVLSSNNPIETAQKYFLFYSFLLEKSKNKNLEESMQKKVARIRELALHEGLATLRKAIKASKETKNLELAFMVFQVSGQILNKIEGEKALKEKLREISMEALETVIEIAKKNRDINTLLELGKGIYALGPFAQKALEAAIELAGEDHAKLFEIGNIIYELWRKEEREGLIETLAIKNALRNLGISVYRKITATTQGEEKILACRRLWILGDYLHAYLGYVSLVNDYKAKNDQDLLAKLYYELGLMATVRGETEKAAEWLTRALKASKGPLRKETIKSELENLKTNKVPEHFVIKGSTSFSPSQIRATLILYVTWTDSSPSPELLEQAAEDLYSAHQKKAEAKCKIVNGNMELIVKEQMIDAIEISGNKKTKTEVILRELAYAGLKPGTLLTTDLAQLADQLSEASNRIKTFLVKEIKIKKEDGKTVLVIEVEEPIMWKSNVGGGAGNAQAFAKIDVGYNNLFGGGEQIGLDLSHHWFYAKGFDHYHAWQGKIYYFDPHLFVLGKTTPVSGGFDLQYQPRMNYENNTLEKMLGGSITLGVKIAKGTTFAVSPQFYYVQNHSSYYEPSLKIYMEKDGRDNWLFPHSGYYLRTSVTPGVYIMDKGNQFFLNNENEARFYIPLPYEMTLALRGLVGAGYGLFGSNKFFLGGDLLNPYVRAAKGRPTSGLGILDGSLELRAPVLDLKYTKIQFYGFGDVGFIFGGRTLSGTGAGARILLPVFGLLNLGWGFPGGFFIWFGNLGWN